MRFTIERLRTLVLVAGALLLVALGAFLMIGKWRNPFNRRDLPKRLGIDIQQEANSVTYTQSHGGRTLYKIHASKVVQLKQGNALLHDVKIELYGEDGSRVDRIEGDEFEYNQKEGLATAAGPVDITLMRPSAAPAIAPKATPGQVAGAKTLAKPLATVAENAASGEIHVKTSGLTFNQNTEVATTSQRVDFSSVQGSGSSMGATYDSQKGFLILDRDVELTTARAGEPVQIHAQHAEFERDDLVCQLRTATADYGGGEATAGEAKILFRQDGSAVRLDATGSFTLSSSTGGHLAAPVGALDFNEHNQPRHGHLEGGVTMDSANAGRQLHGSSPSADLDFTAQGTLRHAHFEQAVVMQSLEITGESAGALRVSRTWTSPVADVEFREDGHGHVEPATLHGAGGVVITGQTQRGNQAPLPSSLAADEVNGEFGPDSALTAMTGVGRARIEETNAVGTRQSSKGDRLEAHFSPARSSKNGARQSASESTQIESAALDGHVVMTQQTVAKPGAQPEAPLKAWAGRAVYEGAGEWLHLTLNPRVEDGGLQIAADKIDVSQESGNAFAHGNIRATWFNPNSGKPAIGAPAQGGVALGGQAPAHVIAAEAQLSHGLGGAGNEVTFRGHARLWQQEDSVAGPVIVLDRTRQTLVAQSNDPAEPVRAVLVSTASAESKNGENTPKPATPSVIRMRGGDLKYSDLDRKAIMRGGALGTVVAETAAATSVSNQVELTLMPPGNRNSSGQGQVDRMTASGRVILTSEGRRGTGEQLVYNGAIEEYVLTGTPAMPPRMSDPARGTVTGEALIFHSRDDSVSIEGGGHKTTTETTVPR